MLSENHLITYESLCMTLRISALQKNFCVSNNSSVLTGPSAPPRDVRIVDVRATNISLAWSPPDQANINGNLLGYKVSSYA